MNGDRMEADHRGLDNISETTRVRVVTRLKSGPDQLEDLLRRLLTAVDTPAPIPEVPVVEKLLQRLVVETQSRPPPVMSHPESVGLETMWRPVRRDWNGVMFFSCGKSGHAATRCPNLDEGFPFMLPRWRAEKTPGGWRWTVGRRKTATDPGHSDTPELSGGTTVGPLQSFGGVGRRDHC